jgi:hypothetical protein
MPPLSEESGDNKAASALKALNINQPLALNELPMGSFLPSDSSNYATGMISPQPRPDDRNGSIMQFGGSSFTQNRLSKLDDLAENPRTNWKHDSSKKKNT